MKTGFDGQVCPHDDDPFCCCAYECAACGAEGHSAKNCGAMACDAEPELVELAELAELAADACSDCGEVGRHWKYCPVRVSYEAR